MSELSKDHIRVLDYVASFAPASDVELRADLRCIFTELEILGLIRPVTVYRLTGTGLAALERKTDK